MLPRVSDTRPTYTPVYLFPLTDHRKRCTLMRRVEVLGDVLLVVSEVYPAPDPPTLYRRGFPAEGEENGG